MEFEWDEAKSRANVEAGRPGFEAMHDFEWATATFQRSDRNDEVRWAATGYIGNRLHRVVYAYRGSKFRIISLRLASRDERRDYAAT